MTPLSAVIITLNEERNINRCLQSIRQVADDIVIVDSHSTDNTKKICKQFGVNFIAYKWQGYSKTKNFGNTQAKHDWILSLDADEELSPQLIESILELKSKNHQYFYKIHRLANYCGKWIHHSGWQNDTKLRLFHRNQTSWEGDYVHENLVITQKKPKHIPVLKGYCYHYTIQSQAEHLAKIEHYSTLAAQKFFAKNRKTNWLEIILQPTFEFLKKYVLKGGFIDGRMGYYISYNSARASFLRYYKLRKLQKTA